MRHVEQDVYTLPRECAHSLMYLCLCLPVSLSLSLYLSVSLTQVCLGVLCISFRVYVSLNDRSYFRSNTRLLSKLTIRAPPSSSPPQVTPEIYASPKGLKNSTPKKFTPVSVSVSGSHRNAVKARPSKQRKILPRYPGRDQAAMVPIESVWTAAESGFSSKLVSPSRPSLSPPSKLVSPSLSPPVVKRNLFDDDEEMENLMNSIQVNSEGAMDKLTQKENEFKIISLQPSMQTVTKVTTQVTDDGHAFGDTNHHPRHNPTHNRHI